MSVDRFLDELNFLLSDLPEEEREEALDFYRCYFEDAGEENEDAVIAELGSPERLAYTIREGLKDKEDAGEYTETGYRTYDDINAPATRDAHKNKEQQVEDDINSYNHISAEEHYKQKYGKVNKKEAKQAKKEAKKESKQNSDKANRSYTEQTTSYAKQERSRRTDSKVPAPLRVIGEILLGILKVLLVIAAICIVILLIAALVALIVAVCASGGVTVGILIVSIGLLATGNGLIGVAMLGITFIWFAVSLLILAALVAFCKKGLAGGIRGITSVTGNVVHGRKKKEA